MRARWTVCALQPAAHSYSRFSISSSFLLRLCVPVVCASVRPSNSRLFNSVCVRVSPLAWVPIVFVRYRVRARLSVRVPMTVTPWEGACVCCCAPPSCVDFVLNFSFALLHVWNTPTDRPTKPMFHTYCKWHVMLTWHTCTLSAATWVKN